MTAKEIIAKFGNPGDLKNLVTIVSPFPMRLSFNKSQTVVKITVHKLAAASLEAILKDLLEHYGLEKLKELGIDLFGGCYNNRPKRGWETKYNELIAAGKIEEAAEYLSVHAWALAVDLDDARNGLKTAWKDANFSKPEYAKMIDIFYKHGWHSLGKEKNYDAMHFQFIKP